MNNSKGGEGIFIMSKAADFPPGTEFTRIRELDNEEEDA